MTEGRKRLPRLIAAAALFGAAALVWNYRDSLAGRDAAPSSADSATNWYCYSCQMGFALTGRQYEGKTYHGRHPDAPADDPDAVVRAAMLVPCPTCGRGAVHAYKCPNDGTIFDRRPANGAEGGCPKCGGNPAARGETTTQDDGE